MYLFLNADILLLHQRFSLFHRPECCMFTLYTGHKALCCLGYGVLLGNTQWATTKSLVTYYKTLSNLMQNPWQPTTNYFA